MAKFDDPLRELKSGSGKTLEQLSAERPQLVVFLRHFGCTFCRESLADLAEKHFEIERSGYGITLVHMVDDERASAFFNSFGLGHVDRISDPQCRLYRMFGLDHGSFRELFGLRVWIRGLVAGLFRGHGIGRVVGNPFQMPGVYVVDKGKLVIGFQHEQASDRPDYITLIERAADSREQTGQVDQTAFA